MITEEDNDRIRIANEQETSQFAADSAGGDEPATGAYSTDEVGLLKSQLAELQDKYLRARAEVDNIARRAQQERADAIRFGNAELLRSFLNIMDDLERTLAASSSGGGPGPVVEAVKLIHDKMTKLLRENAVETIQTLKQPFNPSEHAALLQQPSKDHAPGTVIQEVQKGYRFRDRVLRPAQVIVAAGKAEGETGRGGEGERAG
jgi:molecular chaperone GrpE